MNRYNQRRTSYGGYRRRGGFGLQSRRTNNSSGRGGRGSRFGRRLGGSFGQRRSFQGERRMGLYGRRRLRRRFRRNTFGRFGGNIRNRPLRTSLRRPIRKPRRSSGNGLNGMITKDQVISKTRLHITNIHPKVTNEELRVRNIFNILENI